MNLVVTAAGAVAAATGALVLVRRGKWRGRGWIAALVAAVVGLWAGLTTGPLESVGFLIVAVLWGAATAIDLAEHHLPDPLTLWALPSFLLPQLPWAVTNADWPSVGRAIGGAAMTAVILFALAYINPRGFGLGDVKLGLSTGAALGWFGLSTALVGIAAAFILMALISSVLLLTRRITRDSEVPFGPFMILGVLVAPVSASLLGW